MKPSLKILFTIIGIILLTGCTEKLNEPVVESVGERKIEQYSEIDVLSDTYKLVLHDANGKQVFEAEYPKEPSINKLADGLLEVWIGVGTSTRYVFYFNEETGKMSETYFNPLTVHQGKVVYFDAGKLIVSDIFDKSMYYKEIHRNFSETGIPSDAVLSVSFYDDTLLDVEYVTGEERIIVEESIDSTRVE